MRPKIKRAVIYRNQDEYSVFVMYKFFDVSQSGYYGFVKRIGKPEQDAVLAQKVEGCQSKAAKTYGYRQVWKWLKDRNIK